MKSGKLELTRDSGNVFRDLHRENADVEQMKALLAAEIVKALDRARLTVRAAHKRTGNLSITAGNLVLVVNDSEKRQGDCCSAER